MHYFDVIHNTFFHCLSTALDREMYFTSLMNYLFNLLSAIEEWSRMDYSVQLSLVNNGAFYLLLNELHTAPSAKVQSLYFTINLFLSHR